MRTCPHCAESVQDKAIVCKHCKNHLPPLPKPRICEECGQEDKSIIGIRCSSCGVVKQSAYIAIPLMVILLPAFIYSCYYLLTEEPVKPISTPPSQASTRSVDPEYGRGINIQTCTQMYVENMLKSPSSAKHPWVLASDIVTKVSEGKYRVRSYVDAENAYGAMLRAYYSCEVDYAGEACQHVSCEFDE